MPEDQEKNTEVEDARADDVEFIPDEESALPDLQNKFKKMKDELKRCDTEKKEYLEGWQRAKADYINFRSEEGKRMEDIGRFISAGLVQEMLPVFDSFDLALQIFAPQNLGGQASVQKFPPEIEKGMLLIRSQFADILKKRGLEQIKVEPGEQFNPERHESVGEIESEHQEGTIAEEVQKGYAFRGKVIRPARVRLSRDRVN